MVTLHRMDTTILLEKQTNKAFQCVLGGNKDEFYSFLGDGQVAAEV
jgi:hypothetical protein